MILQAKALFESEEWSWNKQNIFQYNIVIRKGKIVCKVVWVGYYLRLNLSSQATSDTSSVNIECAGKSEWLKRSVLYMWPAFWSFFYSDINLFLIYEAWCKLCNIWLHLCENNSWSITIPELNTGGKYCCSYYSRQGDR